GAGIGSTDHHVLRGALEVVIHDLEGAGTVPARDRLRGTVDRMKVGQPGIDDGGPGAIQADPPPDVPGRGAVDVAAVKDNVRRDSGPRGLAAGGLEKNEPVGRRRRTGERDRKASRS